MNARLALSLALGATLLVPGAALADHKDKHPGAGGVTSFDGSCTVTATVVPYTLVPGSA